jgi:hypothetical protein
MRKSRATSRPQDLENRVALIEAYSRQASLYALLDDEIATREAMKTVLSLAQDTVLRKLPEVQRLAAATHAGLGEKAIRTEKHDDALFHHQQAIKLRRLIANRDGSGDIARMELANSHIALCETAQKMGDKAGVGRECQAGAAILESLVAADPEDMETTYLLTFCYFFLGETDKQYPLLKKLYDAQPENSSYGADLVETAFLSKRFDEVAAIAPDVYLLFGEADPDRVVLSVYWALASGMSGDVETASRVVAQAAQDVELLAGKPAWTFGGTLVVLRTWSGQDAKHALRIVLGLEEWSEKYARGPLQQALHDYMKLLRKQSE